MKLPTHFGQKNLEKGQVLIIVAFIFIGLMAIIGLAIDMGYMYVSYSRVCRAVDAAALGAANQFKVGYTTEQLTAVALSSARQFLKLNDIPLDDKANPVTVHIQTCDNTPGDPDLCKEPRAKLVRVTVTQTAPLFFLSMVGFRSVPLTCTATSEAASVDVVLAIDTSESMTFGDDNNVVPEHSLMRDPKVCNDSDPTGAADGYPGDCHPFQEVKAAAHQFVEQSMYAPYDRVSIVTFDRGPTLQQRLSSEKNIILSKIKDLRVYEGGTTPTKCPYYTSTAPGLIIPDPAGAPCRLYQGEGAGYWGFDCTAFPFTSADGDPNTDVGRCGTTDVGGGLLLAGNEFAGHTDAPETLQRQEALWVVILLGDGGANAGIATTGGPICPNYTFYRSPYCRDRDSRDVEGRHQSDVPSLYDADDYARDMADFVAKDDTGTVKGQNAVVFSIGLGKGVRETNTIDDPATMAPAGEALLSYAAERANLKNPGEYFYAPTGAQLRAIFIAIANKIATRLTK